MIVNLVVSILNVMLKLLAAWIAYLFAGWLQVPEWATIAFIVMAVQSTFITVSKS